MTTPPADHNPEPVSTMSEREESQLFALDLLARLGYKILTREEAVALRGGKPTTPLLLDILREQLAKINTISHKGKAIPFSVQNLRRAVQTLEDVSLTPGLQTASEEVYDLLRRGKSFDQTISGDTKAYTLRYIDWQTPANNVFHVTPEYRMYRTASRAEVRLDLVCFVNGIPFVTFECKAPSVEIGDAVRDTLAYQKPEFVPDLFKYVQVTLAVNRREALYATPGAKAKFWATWEARPEEAIDEHIAALLSPSLPHDERDALAANFVRERPLYDAVQNAGRTVTPQDRAIYNLCRPERLLELTERFILYDGGIKKIARYQQYYAVRRAMQKLLTFDPDGRRIGGVVWHTQGSGKSLTMVMLANAIALSPEIDAPRIVLVTDRVDLDKQLKSTFERCGAEPKRATSGASLRFLLETTRTTIITTLVQKFDAALNPKPKKDAEPSESQAPIKPLRDDSPNIFVLVDESHRTQYGGLSAKMRLVFPRACYIGFTGTPLLSKNKTAGTIGKFGGLIDTYSIDRAVRDKAVVPLLYEARHIEQEVQQTSIDAWFDRICKGLSVDEQEDLKRKYSRTDRLTKTEQRLRMIAYDVSEHYRANWQGEGDEKGRYKAQLVAPDKKSAVRLWHYLRETGHVTASVVISAPVDKEGNDEPTADPLVLKFWSDEVAQNPSPEKYEENTISGFDSDDAPEILIVVDKLLTGFDVPRNTILYLARRLTHHSLLQAIARVNRLYDGKEFGYIIDYVGVLGELDQALTEYRALEGYDEADLAGALTPVQSEYRELPQRHAALLDVFKSEGIVFDNERYERFLEDDAHREAFNEALSAFSKTLKIALSTERFYEEVSPLTVERYKTDLLRFTKLRGSAALRYADAVDFRKYDPQIAKLLDTYVSSDSVTLLTPTPINIFDAQAMDAALSHLETPQARADAIAHATERTITERMDTDPALFRKFSLMIQEAIQSFRDGMLSAVDYLKRATEIQQEVAAGGAARDDSPARLLGNDVAAAYYRVLREGAENIGLNGEPDTVTDFALQLDTAIRREVVVDWQKKEDVKNTMRAHIDDIFFGFAERGVIRLEWKHLDEIAAEILRIARSRL